MAGAPGTPGSQVPPGPDEIWRQIADLQRQAQQALAFAANAQATSAQLAANVAALAASGTTWAGPVASPTSVTAATVTASSDVTSNGTGTVVGVFKNIAAYSNPITTSFRAVWVTSVDGQYGFNLSSREFKQDIATASVDPRLILQLRAVTYRYIQAVEKYGDAAETEFGLIAEEVDELGLTFLVDYDPETGKPAGIKFHLIAIALLSVLDDHEERLARLEARTG